MRLLLSSIAAAGSLTLAAAALGQSTTSAPAVSANSAAAIPVATANGLLVRRHRKGMTGQEQRDQMQLCMAQARLDCIKQGIADALALLLPGARDTATFPSKRMTRPPANGCGQKSRFEKLEPPV